MPSTRAVRRAAVAVLVVLLGAVGGGAEPEPEADAEAPGRVIRYEGDTLSVELDGAPIAEVLDEVMRQSGAELRGPLPPSREVTVSFEGVSVPAALERLLGDENFALIYGEGGQLVALKLLGAPGPPQATPTTQPPKKASAKPLSIDALIALLARQPAVPVQGRLAAAIGMERGTFPHFARVAFDDDDASVRLQAVRAALEVMEKPAVKDTVLATIESFDAGELAELARTAAGDRAEDLAVQVSSQTRTRELRTKATQVLQQLRRDRMRGQAR